jgi:D-alanyl-D-alanine carboxypeptidase (penicillin-binding protein 5/6)
MLSAEALRSIVAENAPRVRRYTVSAMVAVVVMTIGVLVGVQWFGPLPSPVFRSAVARSVRLPGSPPSLPWPTTGSEALSMGGAGSLGHVGSTKPAPIASLTKVMTAYVVLRDHPVVPGAAGPAISVTAATVAAYQTGVATQQSVVRVAAGETLTEFEALQGLLVASGNDIAILLADWDAPSTIAFVAKVNSTAHSLGFDSTHFDDPSGLDPAS